MQVLDASVTIPLFIPEPRSKQVLALVIRLQEEGHILLAPTLWIYEVTSTFQKLQHFNHITKPEVELALETVASFQIELIQPNLPLMQRAISWSQRLRRANAYDSFYLALAEEHGCDLWTADRRLANAVGESWVRLLL